MVNLDVYFNDDPSMDGQAILEENLITNECRLYLKTKLFISKTRAFIEKATNLLKQRFNVVNVTVHWESCERKEK